MRRTVGVLVMEHIAVGLVEGDKVVGPLNIFPEKSQTLDPLQSMPAESIVECVRQQVEKVASGEKIAAIGIGFPGIIRSGVVEDSPNLQQIKGFALQAACLLPWGARLREFRSGCSMTRTSWPRELRRHKENCTNLPACGRSGMELGSGVILPAKASGRVGTPSLRWIPKKISVDAADAATWKAFSAAGPCACASWTWSPKKCSKMLARATRAAPNL